MPKYFVVNIYILSFSKMYEEAFTTVMDLCKVCLYLGRKVKSGLIEPYVQGPNLGWITFFQIANESNVLQEGLCSSINFVSLRVKIKLKSIECYVTL